MYAHTHVSDRIGRRVTHFESRSPSFYVARKRDGRTERNEDGSQRRNENSKRGKERKTERNAGSEEVDGIPARRSKNSPLLPLPYLALFFPSRPFPLPLPPSALPQQSHVLGLCVEKERRDGVRTRFRKFTPR